MSPLNRNTTRSSYGAKMTQKQGIGESLEALFKVIAVKIRIQHVPSTCNVRGNGVGNVVGVYSSLTFGEYIGSTLTLVGSFCN